MRSIAEENLMVAWSRLFPNAQMPVREYRFHETRRWRFDFAWPSHMVAVEIDGRGRHQTVDGVRKDCEKHNTATLRGWRVLRYPATDRKNAYKWADEIMALLRAT